VVPVGSFEQHGPCLPLATDTLIATAISDAISKYQNVFLLPPVAFGCSHEHAAFAGTVSISAATLAAVVGDVAQSLSQQGADALVVVNAHGGNYVLANVVQQANAVGPPEFSRWMSPSGVKRLSCRSPGWCFGLVG
jgi:creatinine amidohydrolase